MECFVIFVMAWCWFNATESKPQNVARYLLAPRNAKRNLKNSLPMVKKRKMNNRNANIILDLNNICKNF